MLELRTHSYLNKASILHIDRREEFKKKLSEKNDTKDEIKKQSPLRNIAKIDLKY